MTRQQSKFWRDVETAYTQVAQRNDRTVEIVSDAEDLTASVEYDTLSDSVVIVITTGSNGNTAVVQRLEGVEQ